MGVFGAQVELGDGGAEERLAGAGGHLEEETMLAGGGGFLEGANGGDLVIAKQADLFVYADLAFFRFGIGGPGGVLGDGDVGLVHGDGGEAGAVGLPGGGLAELGGGQETRDADGVSLREIPVVVEQAVAEENVRNLEAFGVGAGLFLGGERVDGFLLGLDHGDGATVGGEKDVINETAGRVLVVGAKINVWREGFSSDAVFADDVFTPALRIGEEPPARLLQKLVNGDAGLGFGGHGVDLGERILSDHPGVTLAGIEILGVEDFAAKLTGGCDDGGVPITDLVTVLDGEGIKDEFAGDGQHRVFEQGLENYPGFFGLEAKTFLGGGVVRELLEHLRGDADVFTFQQSAGGGFFGGVGRVFGRGVEEQVGISEAPGGHGFRPG